jgi:subtilase family protein
VTIMLQSDAGSTTDGAPALSKINAISDSLRQSPVLAKYNVGIRPLFEGTSGVNDPVLARYLSVTNTPPNADDTTALITELRALTDVQTAYIVPEATLPNPIMSQNSDSLVARDPATNASIEDRISPLFVDQQGYLLAADVGGLDILFANDQRGGRGAGVQVFDIEYAWDKEHEDLLVNFPAVLGTPSPDPEDIFHGTAVAGIIGGDINTIGVNGIAPDSPFFGIAVERNDRSVAVAIQRAVDLARAGDIILLEQQTPTFPPDRPINVPTFVAVEWVPEIFDAIRQATGRGMVVVEAAGNGENNARNGLNFDDPRLVATRQAQFGLDAVTHPYPFDPANPSSGAVLVGAGAGGFVGMRTQPERSRKDFSNYGRRLDVQAWGENIVSSGFVVPNRPSTCNIGPAFPPPGRNQCYTNMFGGTSGASAIIAGVVAATQGILKAAGRPPLTSQQFISLFRDPATGLPQTDDVGHPRTQRIGSLPDMSRLIPRALA